MTIPANPIYGPPSEALRALTPSQLTFLQKLPKAELHAHLNGSIPLPILQDLARTYIASDSTPSSDVVQAGLQQLQSGVQLVEINDFFGLFPAIYALTSTPAALRKATRGVLSHFLGPVPVKGGGRENAIQEVSYLELRTTPRETPTMSRRVYLETVLDEVESYAPESAALIVSVDRRMSQDVAEEVVELAAKLREEGRRVVGVDLCGDPLVRRTGISNRFIQSLTCPYRLAMSPSLPLYSKKRNEQPWGLHYTLRRSVLLHALDTWRNTTDAHAYYSRLRRIRQRRPCNFFLAHRRDLDTPHS